MKSIKFNRLVVSILMVLMLASCDFNIENPNAASEDQVISTVEGLQALAIGMRREYSVNALSSVIRTSALTTREFAVVVGFTNPQEIELGGTALPSENGILTGLWTNNFRVMGMAETIIDNAAVIGEPATRSAYLAIARLFKAMTLGNLAQAYTDLPTSVDEDGDGAFLPRETALQEAVSLIQAGIDELGTQEVPTNVQQFILGTSDFNLRQTLHAFLARYQLALGNNDAAIAAADVALTDPNATSLFVYDDGNGNENPLFLQTTQEPATLRPVDNFGFDASDFTVDATDGRLAFYMSARDEIGESSRIPVETMLGFFDVINESIPVYLPGEMYLTRAEAHARLGRVDEAIVELNRVREKTDDPFGVNAGLLAYSGPATGEAVLDDIYINRRIELFLTGVSLEDSRRFGRTEPPSPASFESFSRNRNFYPFPQTERDNNPNTPPDPTI